MKSYGEKLKIGERKGKMLQKTKVREVFNKYKVQLPTETLNFIDSEISKMIEKWAIRCKNSNIKRLSLNLVGYIGLIMNRDKK